MKEYMKFFWAEVEARLMHRIIWRNACQKVETKEMGVCI
jgi:hypothetical protein